MAKRAKKPVAAKKPTRKKKVDAPVQESVKPSEVRQMATGNELKALFKMDVSARKKTSEIAGEIGQKVQTIVSKYGMRAKSLSIGRQLNRMDDETLASVLSEVDYIRDVAGLNERAATVERLPLGDLPEDQDDEGETEAAATPPADDSKVSRPRFGAKGDAHIKNQVERLAKDASAGGDGEASGAAQAAE